MMLSGSTGEMSSPVEEVKETQEETGYSDLVMNGFKRQFLTFLSAKDDTLLLQTAGSIFSLLT